MITQVFDKFGIEQSWAWLVEQFGPVVIHVRDLDLPGWRAAELHEVDDLQRGCVAEHIPDAPATIVVKVLDENGAPVPLVAVGRWWPDPNLPVLPAELQQWREIGVFGVTNEGGDVGFGMGGGDYYWPPAQGASSVWVEDNSDEVLGLGMIGGTNHRHLDVVYRHVGPSGPGDLEQMMAQALALLLDIHKYTVPQITERAAS